MTWIQTYDNQAFDLVNPVPEQINFEVLATVLARTLRFGGHTRIPYTVAQHCVLGADAIWVAYKDKTLSAAFLLHDCHEAIIGDDTTPKVDALVEIAGKDGHVIRHAIKTMKNNLDAAIYTAAKMQWPLDPETHAVVKSYDIRMCKMERDFHLGTPPHRWGETYEQAEPIEGLDLEAWSEEFSKYTWLDAFRMYCP